MASSALAIASVAPQVTVRSVSGFTTIPYQSWYFLARASRSRLAPQVIAYWLTLSRIARIAASFRTSGQGKLGNPWAKLMAPCSLASRVMPRMTDSVKVWVRAAVCIPTTSSRNGVEERREGKRKGKAWTLQGEAPHVAWMSEAIQRRNPELHDRARR